jgi:hypothetical protein
LRCQSRPSARPRPAITAARSRHAAALHASQLQPRSQRRRRRTSSWSL